MTGRLPPCGTYGDLDGDGFVTLDDVALAKQFVLGTRTPTASQLRDGDLNLNGHIDIGDVAAIDAYAKGTLDTFDICSIKFNITFVVTPANAEVTEV